MISVVTLGRSASTWYCNKLSEETGYENLNEVFLNNQTATKFNLYRVFNKNKNIIIKLTPVEWQQFKNLDITKLLNNSERVILLLRKDFKAQTKSEFAGRYLKNIFGILWHDEFTDPITIPKIYIDTYWKSFSSTYAKRLEYIIDTYNLLNINNKSIVYTEDITANSYKKLNRPIIFETSLE